MCIECHLKISMYDVTAYPVDMIFDDCSLQKIRISNPSLPKHDPPKEILDSMIHDLSHLAYHVSAQFRSGLVSASWYYFLYIYD